MPRPRSDRPYVCGPYKHRSKFRVLVYTPRSDGGRDRRIRSFDSREAAETWKRGFDEVRAAAGRTIGQAVNEYVESLRKKGNKPGSIKTATYRLDAILDSSRALIDLTATRAQAYYDELADEVAVDTHQGCLVAAKAFGRFVEKNNWLRKNPFEGVDPIGKKSRGKAQLNIDDSRKYRRHCMTTWAEHKDRSAIAALLPLDMGLRASEVSQLLAPDVDDRGRMLRVGETDSKTEAGKRLLGTPEQLIPIMIELAATPATPEGHLFAKESGEPADRHWILRQVRRHLKAAKVKAVTAHGLRGTFATLADMEGDRRSVSKSMGHTSTTMTEAHYIDPQSAAAVRINRVGRLLDDE